jgi:deoxyribose-phosphate aldolase
MDRSTLAGMIDHTLLRPEATVEDIEALCAEATDLQVAAVCVTPSRLPLPVRLGPGIGVASVIGFPSGAHPTAVKVREAQLAVGSGATELDVVLDLGTVKEGAWGLVESEVAALRTSVPRRTVLKVILETAVLTDREVVTATKASAAAGADFVKTSTGFHPSGGATIRAVSLMAAAGDGRVRVKASGGIRDSFTALAMVDAGASRLGCSATRKILEGLG